LPRENPEYETVRDEKQRNECGRYEVGGALQSRIEPDPRTAAGVERMEQVQGAEKVEPPDQKDAQPAPERRQRGQRHDRGRQVTIGGGPREGGGEIRGDDTGYQECQADESKPVQRENGPQRVGTGPVTKPGPDV